MNTDNSSLERVEQFKCLETTLTHQNSIQEEIKSRLKSGNVCYHSVRNILSSSLLFNTLKIKIYRTVILPVVLYGLLGLNLSVKILRCSVFECLWRYRGVYGYCRGLLYDVLLSGYRNCE